MPAITKMMMRTPIKKIKAGGELHGLSLAGCTSTPLAPNAAMSGSNIVGSTLNVSENRFTIPLWFGASYMMQISLRFGSDATRTTFVQGIMSYASRLIPYSITRYATRYMRNGSDAMRIGACFSYGITVFPAITMPSAVMLTVPVRYPGTLPSRRLKRILNGTMNCGGACIP